ncbi:MAG: hypothetical protein IPM83_11530 [Ignavibacteria bacterium]|nr:hypothetical protein [Ignavibacteria bacterium]
MATFPALVSQGALSERTVRLATIALCGFANVMSIGIQIGGWHDGPEPTRRSSALWIQGHVSVRWRILYGLCGGLFI